MESGRDKKMKIIEMRVLNEKLGLTLVIKPKKF